MARLLCEQSEVVRLPDGAEGDRDVEGVGEALFDVGDGGDGEGLVELAVGVVEEDPGGESNGKQIKTIRVVSSGRCREMRGYI